MTFEMLDTGPPLTDARIDRLERELRIKLPEGYRSFLRRYNGGHPDPSFFPIVGLENNPSRAIHYFLGIDNHVESNCIDWKYRIYRGRIPRELLPIAGDDTGNVICLSLRGPNEGTVYFWDHDDEHWPPTYRNLYLIAETFSKFLDSIHFEDLSEEVAKLLGKPVQRPH